MIARVSIAVPFSFLVPEGAEYRLYTVEHEGYRITLYPPQKTNHPATGTAESAKVDGVPAFFANGVRIDFQKDQFDRRSAATIDRANPTLDPPAGMVLGALNWFLGRVRYVTRGYVVHEFEALPNPWRLQYLNDDGSDLEQAEGLVRGRGTAPFFFSLITINPENWDRMYSLPPDFEVPVWDNLRLDARAALPKVGTAVVLASAALETFIAHILDALAAKSNVPASLWSWLNNRPNFLADPSTEEQFDELLKEFVGHSLKDEKTLWTAFKHLRTARNKFVHEGHAVIGGQVVDQETARILIGRVDEIIAKVREWLPEDLRWPVFQSTIRAELTHPILARQSDETGDGPSAH